MKTSQIVFVVVTSHLLFLVPTAGGQTKATPVPRVGGNKQTVIAEGAGQTPDDALQDAFRNAIRQVVGALVDSETVVKNDKLISDKVLSYSDGIIKGGYKELSRKEEKGIWRIKIEARVERRSVATRLQQAQIKVKNIQGDHLAIEVLTRKEARQRATDLIVAVLPDLPNVMVADVRKPTARDYNEDTHTIEVDITIRAYIKKYRQYLKRLLLVLEKICLAKDSIVVQAKVANQLSGRFFIGQEGRPTEAIAWMAPNVDGMLGPDLSRIANSWCIWIQTGLDPQAGISYWTYYVLDCDMPKTLASLRGSLGAHLDLVDTEGGIIASDDIPLSQSARLLRTEVSKSPRQGIQLNSSIANPWLAHAILRQRQSQRGLIHYLIASPFERLEASGNLNWILDTGLAVNLIVAPLALDCRNLENGLIYTMSIPYRRVIPLEEEELSRVKGIRATVEYHAAGEDEGLRSKHY